MQPNWSGERAGWRESTVISAGALEARDVDGRAEGECECDRSECAHAACLRTLPDSAHRPLAVLLWAVVCLAGWG